MLKWNHDRIRELVSDALISGRFRGAWEIALLVGISPSALSHVMRGRRGLRPQTAVRLAEVLGVDVRDILATDSWSCASSPRDDQREEGEGGIERC